MVEAVGQLTEFIFESYSVIFFLAGLFQFILSRNDSNIGIVFPAVLGVIIITIVVFMIISFVQEGGGDLAELIVKIAQLLLIVVVLAFEYTVVRAFFY
jgi:hypothetical protein